MHATRLVSRPQRLGFAEADPTADVEGHDARNKLVLLARLAFGKTLRLSDVETRGISGVTADDIELGEQRGVRVAQKGIISRQHFLPCGAARQAGYAVRLIGRAEVSPRGTLHSFIGPALVPLAVRRDSERGAVAGLTCHRLSYPSPAGCR